MCINNYEYAKGPSITIKQQSQSIDTAQGNTALTIQESIALKQRLDDLRLHVQERFPQDQQAQEILRYNSGIDRPMPNRYDDPQVRYDVRFAYDEILAGAQTTYQWRDIWNDNYLTMNANERGRRKAKELGFSSNDPYEDGTRLHWR